MASEGRILVVCTGNVCRSPYLELVLRDVLEPTGLRVESAGTRALVGEPMASATRKLLEEQGIEGAGGFRARALTAEQVRAADLVLTAAAVHRRVVVGLVPGALRRTFVLRQLHRLVSTLPEEPGSPVASLPELVDRAVAARASSGPARSDDDLADPYGQPMAVHRRVAEEAEPAIETLRRCLVPRTATG